MHILGKLREEACDRESTFSPTAPRAMLYRAYDEWAVELEVAELLYSLVRILKPALILESGAGLGFSTRALAAAATDNGIGIVHSYEPDPQYRVRAKEATAGCWRCVVSPGDTLGLSAGDEERVHFVFLDSYPAERRLREIKYWLYRNVTVAIHDAHRYEELLGKQPGGQFFPSPRGLWLRVKRTENGQDQQRPNGEAGTAEGTAADSGDDAGDGGHDGDAAD